MKFKYTTSLLVLIFLGVIQKNFSQEKLWTAATETNTLFLRKKERKNKPKIKKIYRLNTGLLSQKLNDTVTDKARKNKRKFFEL